MYGPFSAAFLHISCVLRWCGTTSNENIFMRTASSHIFCILRWSGTTSNQNGFMRTASSHIFCILRWSGTTSNENGFMCTASSHIFCILKWSEIVIMGLVMFINTFLISAYQMVKKNILIILRNYTNLALK